MLHLPTDEIKVYSVIDSPHAASFDDLALCYAIYFAATLSLEDRDSGTVLGTDKNSSLLVFKYALEQALAHGGLLDRPTITSLHALAIFLVSLFERDSTAII